MQCNTIHYLSDDYNYSYIYNQWMTFKRQLQFLYTCFNQKCSTRIQQTRVQKPNTIKTTSSTPSLNVIILLISIVIGSDFVYTQLGRLITKERGKTTKK